MQAYTQVEEYMKTVGLKYIKNAQDFIAGLAYRTDKKYAQEVADLLNARAEGAPTDNNKFYALKNESLKASVYISAAFDGGVFRHIGNMVIDNAELLKGRVLDLGCDCGIVTCFMAQQNPDTHFVGVDINEKAVENAKALAESLGVTNAQFICCDAYEYTDDEKFDAVTSFRVLLDIADKNTKPLSFIGERGEREEQYKNAFAPYAKAVSSNLRDGGSFISVERYTAEYGWLGWLEALSAEGFSFDDRCVIMRAQDISSTKEYSVTFAVKGDGKNAEEIFNDVLSAQFKSGTGYNGGMAEFALYYDADGEIKITEVRNKKSGRVIHEFAFAKARSGKLMYYDASGDSRKIKYYNEKKHEAMLKDYEKKLGLFDEEKYEVREVTL